MKIKAIDVKKLREETNAGMMDCKKALLESEGDFDKAKLLLREKGQSKADKKSGRTTAQGLVKVQNNNDHICICLLYTSPSPRDRTRSRMPSSA